MESNKKTFLLIIALLTLTVVTTRSVIILFFDLFAVGFFIYTLKGSGSLANLSMILNKNKQKTNSIVIKDGVYIIDNKVKGVLVIDDIPFDYRDLTDESLRTKIVSFHKVLDVLGEAEVIFKKQMIDKNAFLQKLFQKATTLRVTIESDPSNERAKNELEMVQTMIKKINEGEVPFHFIIYIVVDGKSEENALSSLQLLSKGLESIGIKPRKATRNDIIRLLEDKALYKGQAFPTQIPFLTAFSLPKSPKFEFFEDGIYLGKEIGTNRAVFWNYGKLLNPHVLLIGPTGAGKTEFLISLAYKVNLFSDIPIVFFDTKSDIRLRLKKYGVNIKVLNPIIYSLGLLTPNGTSLDSYITQLENIIEYSYQLDRYNASILYKILKTIFQKYEKPTWDKALEELENLDLPYQMKTYLYRIISQIKEYDGGSKYNIVDKIDDNSVYVIDLSLIKSEEVRRLLMLSILTKIYNRYNIADDKLKIGLVVDEAWAILKDTNEYSIIADIIKRGRGYGIMLLMATQNIIDLGQYADIYMQNIGLIAFMNAGDKKFWQEVGRFAHINDAEIQQQLSFLGRGEALIRFITDPRPVIVSLDTMKKT